MNELMSEIINKYQGIAPKQVIHAVEKAAARTGADFSFLMNKAATESSFNPSAKAKTSSATGLFQFIDSTWLNMVKEHGAKYGLGAYANQIEIKNGKACVADCNIKDAILNLRKNPEISALMAGELSRDNKQYLQGHTDGEVGAPELYLAHFMGAAGASKFLNSRDSQGDTAAAQLFPKEAHANKKVFFDSTTGRARTLNDIYDFFAQKFNSGHAAKFKSGTSAPSDSTPLAPAQSLPSTLNIAQALPFLNESGKADEIVWNDSAETKSGFAHQRTPSLQKLSAENILLMAQMQRHEAENRRYNS